MTSFLTSLLGDDDPALQPVDIGLPEQVQPLAQQQAVQQAGAPIQGGLQQFGLNRAQGGIQDSQALDDLQRQFGSLSQSQGGSFGSDILSAIGGGQGIGGIIQSMVRKNRQNDFNQQIMGLLGGQQSLINSLQQNQQQTDTDPFQGG